jgi:uncharacterized protein YbgA (DUF1722 family)/uncharacterized protein YbbK (DUF523 family)
MTEKIRLGISSCILGEKVRYDGGHQLDRYIRDTLGKHVDWVPVCPEVDCGLPVPREAMRLVGTPESYRLVTRTTGIDHTQKMLSWAGKRLDDLEKEELCGFIFKSDSPSSGMSKVKVYNPATGVPVKQGAGLFARAFMERFPLLPVEDDGRLHDPGLRENFIERIFVFRRWQKMLAEKHSVGGLVEFHTEHKLLIMAHSPSALSSLGKLVASARGVPAKDAFKAYAEALMPALRTLATSKKNTNVLQHIMGYFKDRLTPDEKKELLEVIGDYHKGYVPLIVPVTLLRHYVRKYDEPYLKRQHYLHPHPAELMLRNHV